MALNLTADPAPFVRAMADATTRRSALTRRVAEVSGNRRARRAAEAKLREGKAKR